MVHKSLAGATVSLSDTTAGTSVSASQMGVGYLRSIYAGTLNGPSSPVPAFTPITFGDVTFNLSTLSDFNPTKSELYDGSVLQVATSGHFEQRDLPKRPCPHVIGANSPLLDRLERGSTLATLFSMRHNVRPLLGAKP
jgi:hypothetical protein